MSSSDSPRPIFNGSTWNTCFQAATKRPRKQREDFPREDFSQAPWQIMITSGAYKIETTKEGRNFRRKYRVPASVFDFIVETVLHRKLFPEYDTNGCGKDAFGRPIASLHVKIRPDRLQEYHLPTPESDVPTQVESGHFQLKQQLIANLRHQWDRGDVEHLKYPKRN